MALNIGDNFKYQGKKSNFERDSFTTKAAMKAFPETSIDEGHIAFCAEDGQHYVYSASNPMDGTTGKWKPQFKDYAKRTELTPIKKSVLDLEMNATVTVGTANTALEGATARFDEIDPTPTVNIEIQSSIVAGGVIVYSIAKKKFLYRVGGKYYSSWAAQDVPPMTLFQKVEGRTYICGTDMYVWNAVKNDLEKVTTDLTPVQAEIADIKSNITEYNVSKRHPNEGIGGTNKYTLATAIAKIPEELRTVGIKCSFINMQGNSEMHEMRGNSRNWVEVVNNEMCDSEEYQAITLDSDDNILEAIRDNIKEHYLAQRFHAGIEAPEISSMQQSVNRLDNIVTNKENHVVGKSTINKEFADTKSSDANKEWAEVTLGIDDVIVEGTKEDGTKYVHSLQVDDIMLGIEAMDNIKRSVLKKVVNPLPTQKNKDLFSSFWGYSIAEPDYFVDITNPYIIKVTNQADFEPAALKNKINSAISAGQKTIVISLECPLLYYSEDHLSINKTNYPNAHDVRLFIVGDGTRLTAAGADYNKSQSVSDEGDRYVCNYIGEYNPRAALLDQNGNMINMFDDVKYALSQATLDSVTQTWKLKIHDEDMTSEATHIMITGDYVAPIYKIEKMEAGYVYFKNPDSYDWAPNGDYKYAKKFSRYALVNSKNAPVHVVHGKIKIKKHLTKVHECRNACFINVMDGNYSGYDFVHNGNTFKSIDVSGIQFKGCIFNKDKGVVNLHGARGEHSWVHDCQFKYMFTPCIYARAGSCNIKVSDCDFSDIYSGGVNQIQFVAYTPRNITVVRNKFCNSNLRIPIVNPQVSVAGDNALVRHNTLIDCTASISAGFHCTNFRSDMSLGGVIEDNTMYFTNQYAMEAYKHCYMDCGCIYLTMNTNLHIRNNVVANYTGVRYANGVYCDDGARGLKIYSNAIINNSSNGGYDINSRLVSHQIDGTPIVGYNTDNYIGYNLLTTRYRFIEQSNCVKGVNIIFANSKPSEIEVKEKDDDYYVEDAEVNADCIKANASYANIVKDTPISEKILNRVFFNKY